MVSGKGLITACFSWSCESCVIVLFSVFVLCPTCKFFFVSQTSKVYNRETVCKYVCRGARHTGCNSSGAKVSEPDTWWTNETGAGEGTAETFHIQAAVGCGYKICRRAEREGSWNIMLLFQLFIRYMVGFSDVFLCRWFGFHLEIWSSGHQ